MSGSQAAVVQAAVESELKHLLAERNLRHLKSSAFAYSSPPPFQLTSELKPVGLGHQIARAVHGSLTPSLTGSRKSIGRKRGSI
jgi:hypothetical protein